MSIIPLALPSLGVAIAPLNPTILPTAAQDDLQEVASFNVKKCHRVRYSPGGAMFAAVGRNNTIVVRGGGCGGKHRIGKVGGHEF